MSQFTWRLESYLKQTNSFFRFLTVGIINTLLALSIIFLLMHVFRQNYWLSTFLGNTAGMLCSYFLNRNFTFRSNVSLYRGGLIFLLAGVICYFLSYWLSEKIIILISSLLLDNDFLLKKEIAVLLGMFFYTFTNYFTQKHIVFRKSSSF